MIKTISFWKNDNQVIKHATEQGHAAVRNVGSVADRGRLPRSRSPRQGCAARGMLPGVPAGFVPDAGGLSRCPHVGTHTAALMHLHHMAKVREINGVSKRCYIPVK